jgi:hypothetical protein
MRYILSGLGLLFVGIAFIGLFLPGIPTTFPSDCGCMVVFKIITEVESVDTHQQVFRTFGNTMGTKTNIPTVG